MHYSHSQMALLTAICMLGIACTEGPTDSAAELTGPQLAKGGNKGPPAGDPSITVTFADGAGDNIRSDKHATFRNVYEDGVCNVDATFNLEDARLNLKGRIKKKDEAICGDQRFISVAFTDLVVGSPAGSQDGNTVQGSFMNIDHVETVTEMDETVKRTATFHMPGCAHGLRFDPSESEADGIQVSDLDVTKNPNGTWTVATRPSPNNVAVCIPEEEKAQAGPRSYYHMPFKITVTLNN